MKKWKNEKMKKWKNEKIKKWKNEKINNKKKYLLLILNYYVFQYVF
jgi:hypothetical protein